MALIVASLAVVVVGCKAEPSAVGDEIAKSPLPAYRIAFGPVPQPNGDFIVVQRADSENPAQVLVISRKGERRSVSGPEGCVDPIAMDAAYLGDRAEQNVAVLVYCPALANEMLAIVDVPMLRLTPIRTLHGIDKIRLDEKRQPIAAVAEQYDYVAHQYAEPHCRALLDANLTPMSQLKDTAGSTWNASEWLGAPIECRQNGYVGSMDWRGDSIFIIAGPQGGGEGGCGTATCGVYLASRADSTISELIFGVSGNPVLTAVDQSTVLVVGEIGGVRGLWRIQSGTKATLLVKGDVGPASVNSDGAFFVYDNSGGESEIRHIPMERLV